MSNTTKPLVKYVVGFLFDDHARKLWLQIKNRPDWQKNKLNGVGGHIEQGKTPLQAMRREFREEASVDIDDWREFAYLEGESSTEVWGVYFFYRTNSEHFMAVRQMTDEKLVTVATHTLAVHDTIPNLQWLIPMALAMYKETAVSFTICENYAAGT